MDFSFSKTQSVLQSRAAADATLFAKSVYAAEPFGHSAAWRACADKGWVGLSVSKTYTGGGYGALEMASALEALGEKGVERGALFALGAHLFGCAKPLDLFAQDVLRQEWCPRLASGQSVGALALSEATGGSDLGTLETVLTERDGNIVLTGQKTMITNAQIADVFLVLAKEPDQRSPFNLTVVAVPASSAGLRITPLCDSRGMQGGGMAEVEFNSCEIPSEAVLARRGAGLGVVMTAMRWERTCILAGALGAFGRDLRRVTAALRSRGPSGRGLTGHQSVAHRLATLRQKFEMARLVMYRAAWELDYGTDETLYPALSKLTIAQTLLDGAVELQTLMAGTGDTLVPGLALAVQDAMAMSAASGTAEIMKNLIATQLERQ